MPTIQKYTITALLVLALASCTAFYQRTFTVDAGGGTSYDDKRNVLISFSKFMESQGYAIITNEDDQRLAAQFQIRDARSRIMPTSRISDHFAILLFKTGEMRIQLQRVSSYPPDDFSDKYISDFISITEKYIRESSGTQVTLHVLSDK